MTTLHKEKKNVLIKEIFLGFIYRKTDVFMVLD